jgi:cytoskeleton protein RodZ
MAAVGAYLRELRVKRGLSIDELSRLTRVAPRYLEALERDAFDQLPAPVFTRGFIRAYCQAVGVPPEEGLARYDGREAREAVAPAPPVTRAAAVPPLQASGDEPRTRSAILVSFVLLVVLGVALFAVALLTQPAREQRAERPSPPPPAAAPAPAPPVAAVTPAPDAPTRPIPAPAVKPPAAKPMEATRPLPSPAPSFSTTPTAPLPPIATPAPVAPPGSRAWLPQVQSAMTGVSTPYRLVARVSEPTWIRVRTEDGRTTEETVPAGAVREWVSNRPFVITIGNAGGVTFELNGRPLPSFGPSGTVISGLVLPPEGARPQ